MEKEVSIHTLTVTGYFTLEKYINGRPLDELERILGFGKGRLSQGADVYALARLPELNEFDLRGYTTWPEAGVPGMQRVAGRFDMTKLKLIIRREAWSLSGPNRPVKIVPKTGGNPYPVGLGAPQWELVKTVPAYFLKTLKPGEVVRIRRAYDIPAKEKKEEAPHEEAVLPVPEPTKRKRWIEIELVDEGGKPISDVRYQLEPRGGAPTSGKLDGNGHVRVNDVEPDGCKVSFPEFETDEWKDLAATGNLLRFQLARPKLLLRLWENSKPRSALSYSLKASGRDVTGRTDSEGKLVHPVSKNVEQATLIVDVEPVTEEYELTFGKIPSVEEALGAQVRLRNLGYRVGSLDGAFGPRMQNALRLFQKRQRLPVTGELDESTRNRLREVHDHVGTTDTVKSDGGAEDSAMREHARYRLDFPEDDSQQPLDVRVREAAPERDPSQKIVLARSVARSETGEEVFNTFDRVPPRAMLEIEDATYHHNSAVTLPALPTFGSSSSVSEKVGEEGEFTKAVRDFHRVVFFDFWRRPLTSEPGEEELWRRSGLVYVAVVYLFLKSNPSYHLLLAGHTDTSGGDELNFTLGDLRAQNFLFLLRGQRQQWVDNSQGRSTTEDIQLICKYYAMTRGWDSDPGKIDGKDTPASRKAVKGLQQRFNSDFGKSIQVDGKVGKETWGAFFDVYMDELAALLESTVDKLDDFRQHLRFTDTKHPTITCGERIPIEAPERNNFRSSTNRRVEALFFHETDFPDLSAHLRGGKIRSGKAGREASDIYNPFAPQFIKINPQWWTHPSTPIPFIPQFRIELLGEEEPDAVDSSVPIGRVDPNIEREDPWAFLDQFLRFDPGSSGKDDFQKRLRPESSDG